MAIPPNTSIRSSACPSANTPPGRAISAPSSSGRAPCGPASSEGRDPSAGGSHVSLPIITADQRLAEPRGIKGCIFGKSGLGKTSLLWTLERLDHALLRPRGRRSRDRGLAGRRDPSAHLDGVPRFRGLHRRAEPGAAPGPVLQPGALRRGLHEVRRSRRPRSLRHHLHRLDHRRRAALLPVVQGPARGASRRRPASRTCAAPTGCTAAR